jgi:hypothetical protein
MKSGKITGNTHIRSGSDDTTNWAWGGGVGVREGGAIYGKTGNLPDGTDPSLANNSALPLRGADPPAKWARWGTGGIYTKGGVIQTGTDIGGDTDDTLIAIPAP